MELDSTTLHSMISHNDLDLLGDRVIHSDGQQRIEYWKTFQKVFEGFVHKEVRYGRIHIRYLMCNVAVMSTLAADAELLQNTALADGELPKLPLKPFLEWSHDDWDSLEKVYDTITELLMRRDATYQAYEAEDDSSDDDEDRLSLLSIKLQKVHRYISLHRALSVFRKTMEEQLDNDDMEDSEVPKVNAKLLQSFWELFDHEEDKAVVSALDSLFQGKGKTKGLRNAGELRQLLQVKPLSFASFYERINVTISDWADSIFEIPLLFSAYFPKSESDEESSQRPLKRLRAARQQLRQEGEDPLEESVRIANQLNGHEESRKVPRRRRRTSAGASLLKKRKTATRLEFDEEDEVEEPEEEHPANSSHLSELPRRAAYDEGSSPRKQRKSQQKKYQGRRAWTDEERRALLEGIREFGVGKWAAIKDHYKVIFSDRTSGQLKDCFRTLKKRGELDDSNFVTETV